MTQLEVLGLAKKQLIREIINLNIQQNKQIERFSEPSQFIDEDIASTEKKLDCIYEMIREERSKQP